MDSISWGLPAPSGPWGDRLQAGRRMHLHIYPLLWALRGEKAKYYFEESVCESLISHCHQPALKKGLQVPNPPQSLLGEAARSRWSCSWRPLLEKDGVELNQQSAGRRACYQQDEATYSQGNFHARTCTYSSARYCTQSIGGDGTLSCHTTDDFSGNATPAWTGLNKAACANISLGRRPTAGGNLHVSTHLGTLKEVLVNEK